MTRSSRGVPAKQDQGNSRAVTAAATAHRVRAMLDDVLAELERERVNGKRDWRKKLVDDFHASDAPLVWLQQFRDAAGVKDIEPGAAGLGDAAGAALAGFAGVFAGVVAQQAATQARIIDVPAEPVQECNTSQQGDEIDW